MKTSDRHIQSIRSAFRTAIEAYGLTKARAKELGEETTYYDIAIATLKEAEAIAIYAVRAAK